MSDLLRHKAKYLRAIVDCPLCGSFRQEVYFPDDLFDAPEVDDGYLPRPGAQASAGYHCGFELAIDEFGEIIHTRQCHEIGTAKADELNEMAEESFKDGDDLEPAQPQGQSAVADVSAPRPERSGESRDSVRTEQ